MQDLLKTCLALALLAGCESSLTPAVKRGGDKPASQFPDGASPKLLSPSCRDPDLTKVAADVEFMLCNGTMAKGSYVPPKPCAADGAAGCLVDGETFKAADVSLASPRNIVRGATIAGVAGQTDAAPQECHADGGTACVASANFPAVDLAKLIPSNIPQGLVMGGVAGTRANVNRCKSGLGILISDVSGAIPWDGVTAGGGTVAINNGSNVVTGTGTYFTTYLSVGDRITILGETHVIATITSATSLTVDANFSQTGSGATFTFAAPVGDKSVDDMQGNHAFWYTGVNRSNCNESNVTDVTNTGSGFQPDTGKNAAWSHILRDDLSGIHVTNVLAGSVTWTQANITCEGLNGGSGGSGWRVPTQKEAMQLYVDGLTKALDIPIVWTSTSASWDATYAYSINLRIGVLYNQFKAATNGVFCVR